MTLSPVGADGPDRGFGPLDGYRERLADGVGPYTGLDEMVDGDSVRPDQLLLADALQSMGTAGLLAARAETRRLVNDDGIRYGVADVPGGQRRDRSWKLDPLPLVISHEEWMTIERGVKQRAALLDALLDDFYGERKLLRSGVIPAEVVLGHPGFLRQVDGIRSRGGLVLGAHDLGRDAHGTWRLLADRTSAPSGAGYAMANRRITTRVLAGLHRSTELERLRGFFHTMSAAVRDVAPPSAEVPRAVLLSPGPMSETAYDQSFVASLLGFPLAEADDLTLRDGKVWLRAAGRLEPVDVVLRRVDPEYCDPLDLRSDSQLGLPGLVEATRQGAVTVATPLGAQVLENPGLAPFLPAVAKAVLGEELLLQAAPTWWCGDADARRHVVANVDRLVVRPLHRGTEAALFGPELDAAGLDDVRRRIAAEPWAWVGQEPVPLSSAPIVTPTGLQPGRVVLRTFWVNRDGERHVLPGGLARVATSPDSIHVSSSTGAVAKDVWVLAGEGQAEPWTDYGIEQVGVRPLRGPAAVAPRVADNLFWIGRYSERAECAARLLRVCDDLVEDNAARPGTPGEASMRAMLSAAQTITRVPGDPDRPLRDHVRTMVADDSRSGTVRYAADRLNDAAQRVRDQLSHDIWHVLSRLERTLAHIPPDEQQLQPQLYNVLESLLAVSGVISESMVRDESWGFLDGGMRMERAQFTVSLLQATLAIERPPIIDGQVTESVLEVGESILTHRRRTFAGEGPVWPVHSAVSLLLLDRGNPRSVAFCVDRLVDDLRLIGDEVLVAKAAALAGELALIDLVEACAGDRTALSAILFEVRATLAAISDELDRRRFRRKPSQRTLPFSWAVS